MPFSYKTLLGLFLFLPFAASCQQGTFPGLQDIAPNPQTSLAAQDAEWYKDAVFYHLWIKSFADSNGDGIGDLRGIIGKLDYLSKDLGITAVWLSPHMATASTQPNLHGYDVIDHYKVDPRFGTNDDLAELLREGHKRGVRFIFDFVPNHVSARHPWFQDARANRNGKREWFKYRESRPATGWTGFDRSSDWHSAGSGSFYYGIFWNGMPDLNYRNTEVRTEMAKVARFWLDFGFDGIRVDAVRYLYENEEGSGTYADFADRPETLTFFEDFRAQVLDPYTQKGYPKFMVAENWVEDQDKLQSFLGTPERPSFHMTFDFPAARMMAEKAQDPTNYALDDWWQDFVSPFQVGWMGTFLSNHDNVTSRPASVFDGEAAYQKAAAAIQLTGVGTPFLYYGNEVGLEGEKGDDINLRAAFPWDRVGAQKNQPNSLLKAHRDLIALRKAQPALSRGTFKVFPTPEETLFAFTRTYQGKTLLVIHNLGQDALEVGEILKENNIRTQIFGKTTNLPPLSVGVWALP